MVSRFSRSSVSNAPLRFSIILESAVSSAVEVSGRLIWTGVSRDGGRIRSMHSLKVGRLPSRASSMHFLVKGLAFALKQSLSGMVVL